MGCGCNKKSVGSTKVRRIRKVSKPIAKVTKVVRKTKTIAIAINSHYSNDTKAIAKAVTRYPICCECEHAKKKIHYRLIKDSTFPKIEGMGCEVCGCSLSFKIRSRDCCPIEKW